MFLQLVEPVCLMLASAVYCCAPGMSVCQLSSSAPLHQDVQMQDRGMIWYSEEV